MLADERLAPYFADADVAELRHHQAAFLTCVTGGTEAYDGRTMREPHAGLGITVEDFASVAEHLRATLVEFDVPDEHADAVLTEVASLEDQVVGV